MPKNTKILEIQNIDLADVLQGKRGGAEENVKLKIVLPLLQELGFDPVKDMDFEHFVENKRADIAILVKAVPKIIVECKSLEKNLDDHISQALGYAIKKQIPYVLLTNGNEFRLYKSFIENLVNPQDRLLSLVKLKTLEKDFSELSGWISKNSLEKNKIDKKAKKVEEELRQKITAKTLIENLKNAKETLSNNAEEKILPKFSSDAEFRQLVDKWVADSELDIKNTDAWVKVLANEMAYSFINKLYFYRIAEDNGIVIQKLNKNALGKLTQFMPYLGLINAGFAEILRIDYQAIFKHDLFDKMDFDERLLKKIVDSLSEYNFAVIDSDILGRIYQQHVSRDERKALGQFYTPEWIIEFILKSIPLKTNDKILDPACGSGGFLIRVYDKLKEIYLKEKFDKNKIHQTILEKNLYGQDINPFAVHLTAMNLALKSIQNKTETINVLEKDSLSFKIDWFLKPTKTKTLDNKEKEIDAMPHLSKSEVIVGNPPYFNLSQEEIKKKYAGEDYAAISSGVTNIAALFLKRYIDLLKDNGYLGFVVPKSLTYQASWQATRKFVLDNCQILKIFDLHEAFDGVLLEQIAIVLKKTTSKTNSPVEVSFVELPYDKNKTGKHKVAYNLFTENFFPIYRDEINEKIFETTSKDSIFLSELLEFPIFRGAAIQKYDYLFTDKPQKETDRPLLRGVNIDQFGFKDKIQYISSERTEFTPYKKQFERLNNPKIVAQRLIAQTKNHMKLIAALDKTGEYLEVDTVNNIVLKNKDYSLEYILAIINSKFASYYIYNFVFNRAVRTMDFLYVAQLPIKKATKQQQSEVEKAVNHLLSIKNMDSKEATDLLEKIDKVIYKIYGLKTSQIKTIEDSFK
jgi:type I restriction-modification system DNA methylase subunit